MRMVWGFLSGLVFGLGLILGHCLESWLLCCCGGLCLMALGCCVTRHR